MGFTGCLAKCALKALFYFLVVSAIIILLPGLPPYVKFTAKEKPEIISVQLSNDNTLKNTRREYQGKLHGPEAFQVHNGELYTTLGSGELAKVTAPNHLTFVTKVGKPCAHPWQGDICGRPLGFRIDEQGNNVYISDAYLGIWKVNLKTDTKQMLISPDQEIGGRKAGIFNSVALAKNGDIYWTDSTSEFPLHNGVFSTLADPAGRLIHYDAAKKTNTVLLDNLWFANGVALSPNEDFVIVAETINARIWKVYLTGAKKGQKEHFAYPLPGVPDNIQPLPDKSGVLVAMYAGFDEESPMLSLSLMPVPLVRKAAARALRLLEIPFEFINQYYPNHLFDNIVYQIGHFSSMKPTLPPRTGFIRLDWSGKIVETWFTKEKNIETASDVIVYNNKLYFGSPANDYIGVADAPESLKQAFKALKATSEKKTPETVTAKIPDVGEKPKVQAKAKVEEPKVEVVKETVKQVKVDQVKTVKQEQAKAVPKVEPKPTPKVEVKPITIEEPKPTPKVESKPTPKVEAKPTPKVEPKPTPKAEPKPTPKEEPKPTPKVEPKPAPKVEPKPTPKVEPIPTQEKKQVKKEIPIKEEIVVDTQKPVVKPLKVIKKEGPAEIPNPAAQGA